MTSPGVNCDPYCMVPHGAHHPRCSPDAGATPTDAERVRGLELATDSQTATWRATAIAQALADQRAKYEAVADELDQWLNMATRYAQDSSADAITGALARGRLAAYKRSADAIRKVSG